MTDYIKKIKQLYEKSLDLILEELNKYDLEEVEKIYVLKEALGIDKEKAQSLYLNKHKGKITDDLLDGFLNDNDL